MPTIYLTTHIKADVKICFDLSRSVDLHIISTSKTNEKAIAGKISGLVELNDYILWEAKHFGVRQKLTSKITACNSPTYFRDEQIQGAFKLMNHDHFFEQSGSITIMRDVFTFEAPFGIIGKAFSFLILKKYLIKFLITRNTLIKDYAESDQWKDIIK